MTAFGDVLRTAPGVLCWTRTHVNTQPPWHAHVRSEDLAQVMRSRNGNTAYRIGYRWSDAAGDLQVLECAAPQSDGSMQVMLIALDSGAARTLADSEHGRLRDERLSSLTRLSSDWLWETDADDRFIYVSEGLTSILGMAPEQVLGRQRGDIAKRADQPGLVEVRRLVAAHTPFRGIRYELEAPTGRRHIEIAGEPHFIGGRFAGYRGIAHDVTADVEQTRALQRANRRLRAILDSTPAGYVETGADGLIRRVNPALSRLSGRPQNALLGQGVRALFPDLPDAADMAGEDDVLHAHDYETRLLRYDGEELVVSLNASIEFDEDSGIESMTAFVTDITERKLAEQELEKLALNDPVTGLHNRSFVEMRLDAVLETAPRGETNAVMFIDLDRFKEVNDTLGHDAGDYLLREIGHRLKAATRPGDIVARFGGDEFVIITHCQNGESSARSIAAKLCEAVAQPVDIDGTPAQVGASIGVSLFPRDGRNTNSLFRKADAAMYSVKRSGRDGWRLYDASLHAESD